MFVSSIWFFFFCLSSFVMFKNIFFSQSVCVCLFIWSSFGVWCPQGNEELRVVGHGNLISILRGMDTTRLLGLTADKMSMREDSNGKMGLEIGDAGGEEPYNPRDEQLVLMVAVMVDGQPAVGADVIKAELATQNLEGEFLWKFRIRDFAFQPV